MRSLLFAPADRLDLVAKLPRTNPDAICLDLEDGVAPADKDRARAGLAEAVASVAGRGCVVTVRVNAVDSPLFAEDAAAVAGLGAVDAVVVPKVDGPDVIAAVTGALPGLAIIAGVETTRGVLDIRTFLSSPVTTVYFGAEDYVADLGGVRTVIGTEVLYARSHVALACRVHGIHTLDQIVAAIGDDERFVADAQLGRSLGYGGKLCVHPRQVTLTHDAFTPSADELDHARRVLAAGVGKGVVVVDGAMIDEPMLRAARAVLTRAGQNA